MCFWRLHRLRHGPIDFRFNIVFGCRRSVLLLLLRLRRRRYRRPVFARESTKHVAFLWSTRIRRFAIIDLAILLFLTFWSTFRRRRRRRRFLFLRILLFIVSRRQSIENARFVVVFFRPGTFNIRRRQCRRCVIRSGCTLIRTLLVLIVRFFIFLANLFRRRRFSCSSSSSTTASFRRFVVVIFFSRRSRTRLLRCPISQIWSTRRRYLSSSLDQKETLATFLCFYFAAAR